MDTDDLLSRLLDVLHDAAAADGVLPSEPTLADQLGVSRPNLREVLARLQAQGLVLRRRGSETVVNTAALDLVARFDQTFDYAALLEALGHTSQVDVLGADLVPLDADTAAAFGRAEGTIALRTVKRWRADGSPAMAAVNLVPMPEGTTSVPSDVTTSVFDFAAEVAGEAVVWTIARPGAIALDDREAGGWSCRAARRCSPSSRSVWAAAAGCSSPAPSTTSPAWCRSPWCASSRPADPGPESGWRVRR